MVIKEKALRLTTRELTIVPTTSYIKDRAVVFVGLLLSMRHDRSEGIRKKFEKKSENIETGE
jgi:hypothetical protein